MTDRNRNIFVRKENAYNLVEKRDNHPVFAHVVGYNEEKDMVLYEIDYPLSRKQETHWRYGDSPISNETNQQTRSGTYIKTLDDFLALFEPDYYNRYQVALDFVAGN